MKRKFSMFLNIAMLALCVCAIAFGVYSAKTANLNVAGNIGFKAHNCDVDITASIYGHANGDDPLGTPVLKEDAEPLNGGNTLEIRATSTNTVETLNFGDRYFSDMGSSGEVEPITIVLTITNTSNFHVLLDDQTATNASYTSVCSNPLHVLYIDSEPEKTTTLTYTLCPAKDENGNYVNIDSPVDISLSMNFSKIDTDMVGKESDGWLIDEDNVLYEVPEADSSGLLVIPTKIETSGGIKDVLGLYLGTDEGYDKLERYTKVVIPRSVTSLEADAFLNCSSLTAIAIPNNVNEMGTFTFSNCSSLTSITIPSSVTSISNYAFNNCSSLTSITIPSSVTSIGNSAFHDCSSLTSITIPSSVTGIYDTAFNNCSSLTRIVVESGNTTYDSRDNCNAIIKKSNNELITGCKNTIIPSNVNTIGTFAFSGCSGLTSVSIPSSVNSIDGYAFSGCNGLTSIVVEAGNAKYDSRDNCNAIIEKASNTLIAGCKATVIPNTVTSIGNYAFNGRRSLTSINIPGSVTSIGDYAFQVCSNLTSITIPESVNSIGYSAFSGCTGLTDVIFEDTSKTWTVIQSYGYGKNSRVDVSNPATNATNFTGQYLSYIWTKNS